MAAGPKFVRSAERQQVELWPGIRRRTLGWGDHTLLAEITLQKGSLVAPHSHLHEQIGYVAKGRLEFTVDGETAVMEAGDGYTIPGNAIHSVRALEDSIAIDVFSPVRDEYKS